MRFYTAHDVPCKLENGAFLPERAHKNDAGADLRTPERVVIHPHDRVKIDTGVSIEMHGYYFGLIAEKSSLALKGISVHGGVIDEGYRGRISVVAQNDTEVPYIFEKGDKIAQLIIMPVVFPDFVEVKELDETERGVEGFGSTGK